MTTPRYPRDEPRRTRIRKGLKRIEELAKKYEAEGMSKDDARERALAELRGKARSDWRAG